MQPPEIRGLLLIKILVSYLCIIGRNKVNWK